MKKWKIAEVITFEMTNNQNNNNRFSQTKELHCYNLILFYICSRVVSS